ncbi:ferritin-like domain-containing protein [Paracnuella aquatica]|uniref:ferritin-like domain-containing protein n=1 Tax=Paracnuella aquatica TaxID=2268757 RepID=UPI000DEEE921|nr:ferritin-like domain-containing protein [Paracnuella aquatica]RPD44430.1 ferritin-like domain-containing protein [Paracnuella aquatica]
MNLYNVVDQIEKLDPDMSGRLDGRRAALKQFTSFAGKVALAAVPLSLGGMLKKAYGQSVTTVLDVLNYALTLEYLEAEFYTQAVASAGLIPAGAPTGAITTIRDHENAHVAFLRTAIQGAGGTPVNKPNFDFTAGGAFANVFSNYDTFLAVAQAFEDTGVRAYKGQAAKLISNNDVLTAALNIHSVEARHASHIRQMRRARGAAVKPWITGKDLGGLPAATAAIYAGEENATQAGVEITNINGMSISMDDATEAFDEPLTEQQVLAIVRPFIR